MKASARLDAFLPEKLNIHYRQAITQIKSYAASKTLSPAVGIVGMLGRGWATCVFITVSVAVVGLAFDCIFF